MIHSATSGQQRWNGVDRNTRDPTSAAPRLSKQMLRPRRARGYLLAQSEAGGIVSTSASLAGDVQRAGWLARIVSSSAAQVCEVADGRAVGSIRGGGNRRDLHGPALLVAEAGGVVTDPRGAPWDGASKGLVLGHADAHAALLRLAKG